LFRRTGIIRSRCENELKAARKVAKGVRVRDSAFANREHLTDRQSTNSRNYSMSLSTQDYSLGGLATALDGVGKDPLISSL
jgi:hypothetical protein